jgi:ribonuclease P protein component
MSIEAFPITLRLTKSAQYQAVFDQSDFRIPNGPLLLLARKNQLSLSRIGLVLSKKHIPLAVQRNRVKRLLRESFRRHQKDLPGFDIVILARRGLAGLDNGAILNNLTALWEKLAALNERSKTTQATIVR